MAPEADGVRGSISEIKSLGRNIWTVVKKSKW
jgi:hypothetical protein